MNIYTQPIHKNQSLKVDPSPTIGYNNPHWRGLMKNKWISCHLRGQGWTIQWAARVMLISTIYDGRAKLLSTSSNCDLQTVGN